MALELAPGLGACRAPGFVNDSSIAALEPEEEATGESCEAAWAAAAWPNAVNSPVIVDFVCHDGIMFCCLWDIEEINGNGGNSSA